MAGDYSIGSKKWPGLSKLIEEMGELHQVIGKIIAVDGGPQHWDGPNLITRLEQEVADVQAALQFVLDRNPIINNQRIQERFFEKIALFNKWHSVQK